jgi:site-specific DNA-methyltransferase (adenine-specific)
MKHFRKDEKSEFRLDESSILQGDALDVLGRLPAECIQCVVTSPPYWGLRDYKIDGQIGLEPTLDEFLGRLVAVFREVKRVMKEEGTLWLNIGDGYTSGNRRWRATDKKNPARAMDVRPDTPEGLKPKDLLGIPWRLAFELQRDGWYLRSDIVWNKPNAMPESVKDRPTRAHEYIFLLTKAEQYYYDYKAIIENNGTGRRNRRSVWSVNTQPFADAHFATFPPALIEPCILAGSKAGDYVLDPFFGSGTVGLVCQEHERRFVGIELRPEYIAIARRRLAAERRGLLSVLESPCHTP